MMIRTLLLLALVTLAAIPAGHAAEPTPGSLVLTQAALSPAPLDPTRAPPQAQMPAPRNAVYVTAAVLAMAGGAGALVATFGGGILTTALVVSGAVGFVYLAASDVPEER